MRKRDLNKSLDAITLPPAGSAEEMGQPVEAADDSVAVGENSHPAPAKDGKTRREPSALARRSGQQEAPERKAMILAAGLGTRLKPFTDHHPKALAMVNGKPLLQRNIEYLARFGIKKVIVNVHHFADQIIEFVHANRGFGSSISFSDETNEVLETGGGLQKAAWFFEEDSHPFVMINVDILTDLNLTEMIAQHQLNNPLATLAVTTRYTSRYFLFDESDHLCGWKNEKTGERKTSREAEKYIPKAFSGIHVISPKIFPLIRMKGRFSMVDVYLELARNQVIEAFDHSSNSKFIDVGRPESILKAEKIFR